jgi:uncharacterized protein (DUF924 family)
MLTQSATPPGEPAWVAEVLRFWFAELRPADWFARSEALDATIRLRFAALHARLVSGAETLPDPTPRSLLAAVVVLDQFSRNLHRDDARAFAADAQARTLAHRALELGADRGLSPAERLFFYLPFEHSEDLADQHLAVRLVGDLGDAGWNRYAEAHRDIIARFGRFPHRNVALGRASTAEELAFLQEPMSRF